MSFYLVSVNFWFKKKMRANLPTKKQICEHLHRGKKGKYYPVHHPFHLECQRKVPSHSVTQSSSVHIRFFCFLNRTYIFFHIFCLHSLIRRVCRIQSTKNKSTGQEWFKLFPAIQSSCVQIILNQDLLGVIKCDYEPHGLIWIKMLVKDQISEN